MTTSASITPIQENISTRHIADNGWYNAEMAKSLIDKIFFLDKVDARMFVDFGCANGEMLLFIEKLFPEMKLIGYDVNKHARPVIPRYSTSTV